MRLDWLLEVWNFPSFRFSLLFRHVGTSAVFLCCGKNSTTHSQRYIYSLRRPDLAEPHTLNSAHVVNEMIIASQEELDSFLA